MKSPKTNESPNLKEIELPEIVKNTGIQEKSPELLIYDSSKHGTDYIRNKPFRSEHFSMILMQKGEMNLKVNLIEYHMKQNGVIIIPPSAIRQFRWENEMPHFTSLLFTADYLKNIGILGKYFNVVNFLKEGLAAGRNLQNNDKKLLIQLTKIIYELQTENDQSESQAEIIKNLFQSILIKVKTYYEEMEDDQTYYNTLIYRFMNLLSAFYLTHREVTFYSEKLNINEKYLSQLLKSKTGKTARQFITEIIVLEAKVLLDDKSLTVKEISEHLNFENQFHFSRFFKQYSGTSPMNYRKQ